MTQNSPRLRRAGAGAALGALVASTLLVTSPAQAATITITPNKVDQSDTRATGHNVFSTAGVRVYTEGATGTDKAAGYFAVSKTLAAAGEPTLTWTGSATRPGTQLVTDFDGNGTADAILVGEPANSQTIDSNSVPDWWVPNSAAQFVKDGAPSQQAGGPAPGGSGSVWHGTLDQWRAKFPNAKVLKLGWSLGSGVKGDGTISKITLGTDEFVFGPNTAPTAGAVTASVRAGDVVSIPLTGADADGDTLTYSAPAAGSAATISGSTLTYTAPAGFDGTSAFTYTVSDGLSSATGTVAVKVAKNNAPVVSDSTVATKAGAATFVSLPATDADGDTLTYVVTASNGTVGGTGTTRTFTPAAGFAGSASVSYTVTDGRGGSATGTVTVNVAKLVSKVDVYRTQPKSGKITTKNKVSVYATVTVDGKAAPKGTVVDVSVKGKKVGTAAVNSNGKVKVTLKAKLKKGTSTIKVSLAGSPTLDGSSDSVKVKVIKK